MKLDFIDISQGWGVAVLVGVPHKDAVFKTHPVNFLNERTLKGTFFGNYKPRSDIPSVVEKYMNKVSGYIHYLKLKLNKSFSLMFYNNAGARTGEVHHS